MDVVRLLQVTYGTGNCKVHCFLNEDDRERYIDKLQLFHEDAHWLSFDVSAKDVRELLEICDGKIYFLYMYNELGGEISFFPTKKERDFYFAEKSNFYLDYHYYPFEAERESLEVLFKKKGE